jgi:invasion protein IalB
VLIAPGVEVRLGKAATRKAPFAFCDNGRCTATLNIDQNAVRDITNAGTAEVVIHAPNVGGIQFSFPVKGFDKAYAEVIK